MRSAVFWFLCDLRFGVWNCCIVLGAGPWGFSHSAFRRFSSACPSSTPTCASLSARAQPRPGRVGALYTAGLRFIGPTPCTRQRHGDSDGRCRVFPRWSNCCATWTPPAMRAPVLLGWYWKKRPGQATRHNRILRHPQSARTSGSPGSAFASLHPAAVAMPRPRAEGAPCARRGIDRPGRTLAAFAGPRHRRSRVPRCAVELAAELSACR